VEPVALAPEAATFDDITFSASLGRVLAAPEGIGTVYSIDPDSLAVTAFADLPRGVASVDEGAGWLFAADRDDDAILVLDPSTGTTRSTFPLEANPDYVRYSPATGEVWITEPGRDRIEVLSLAEDGTLAHAAFIATPGGPEGLAFDVSRRRAFAHASGDLAVIDVDRRERIDSWPTGCGGSHGIPTVDEARGLVFAGCSARGGGAMLDADDGRTIAGYEVGEGEAVLGYSAMLGHFYLRGDPGRNVAALGVCDGGLSLLGTAVVSNAGHGMVADDRGNLWVCDHETGGVLRVRDHYPAAD
jgi:streptogramin lyase